MEKIEAEKSKVEPQRPPRRLKVRSQRPPRTPKVRPTARVTPNIPDRNPFDPPSPPIFRHRTHTERCSCCSYLFTNEGIEWNSKQLPVCFVAPIPMAPPTPSESSESPFPSLPNSPPPNSPFGTLPPTPDIERALNEYFTQVNLGHESPVPAEDLAAVLDSLYEQQAARHPQAEGNSPFLFLNAAESAPEADLPEDLWDLPYFSN